MKTIATASGRCARGLAALVLAAAGFITALPAVAATYGFDRISDNASIDISNQLSMDVTAYGQDSVLFTFYNNVGIESSITDIYFDLGDKGTPGYDLLSSITFSIANTSWWGTLFDNKAAPKNLPEGKTLADDFVADFSGDSIAFMLGTSFWGVNTANEWVSFVGKLGSAGDLDGVVTALSTGQLRVGLHVQSIMPGDKSDSFVNKPENFESVSAVPLPAAGWLFGSALVGFVMMSNRRKV